MANPTISAATAIAACDAIVDLLDGGTGAGTIKIYDGSQPADPDEAVGAQTLLSEHDLNDPAFGAAADDAPGGKATANAIADDSSANATGTAAWFRASDGDGTAIIDGDVTATGGGGDMEINSTSISSGATVSVTGWNVTMPQS